MASAWTMVTRFALVLFCIYLVAGGIFLMITALQQLEWAGPIPVGALSILIAYLAKLVFKDEIQAMG